MINITNKVGCCGCTACANACPMKCIEMKADKEGFLYPEVDTTKCVQCGLCDRVCPIQNSTVNENERTRAFIYQYQDDEVLKTSTSGGLFSALAESIISVGGYVCAAEYDENFVVRHSIRGDLYESFRESKYAQSNLDFIFSNIKELLESGEKVLFCGTPCQVAGLKSFLRKEYEQLLTVDIICRSIPSPILWEEYKKYLKGKYESAIISVKFRNKTYGYHKGTFWVKFENGKEYIGSNRVDMYMKAFHKNICSRPSCYDCRFKSRKRVSDVTLFDCWSPNKIIPALVDNNKGYTGVLVHSNKGENILMNLQATSYMKEVSVDDILQFTGNMAEMSIDMPESRKTFYDDLNRIGFENTIKSRIDISLKDLLIEKSKKYLYKRAD